MSTLNFTHLPALVQSCICTFLPNDDLVSNASTTKLLRKQALEALSKCEARPRRPGVVECERVGPYIGKVTINVEAETEPSLGDVLSALGRLGALESLIIGEESSASTRGGKRPCKGWGWLGLVTNALQDARGQLPRLREVWLRAYLSDKHVAFRVGSAPAASLSHITLPAPSTQLLQDFLSALPPGVTRLQLGPALDFPFRTCGLSSDAYVSVLRLLETGVLPNLRDFIALVDVDTAVYNALISLLHHAPFAPVLERLLLGDSTYKGPKDLTALVGALANCPKLTGFGMGRGSVEAQHFFDLMGHIISGRLPEYACIPTSMELPVKLRTYEDMDRAVSLILHGLQAGRFRGSRWIMLGDDASQVALPDATFDRLLTGTPPQVLPCLDGALLRCVPGPALAKVGDWLAGHKTMLFFVLYCGGLRRGGRGEGHLLTLVRRLIEDPALERLRHVELVWVNQPKETEAAEEEEEEGKKPCCLLKGVQDLMRRARRRPPRGKAVEVSVLSMRDLLPGESNGGRVARARRQMEEEEECELEHSRFCRARSPVRVILNLTRPEKAKVTWEVEKPLGLELPLPSPSLPRRGKWLHGGGKAPRMMMDQRFALFDCGEYKHMAMGTIMAQVQVPVPHHLAQHYP